MADLLSRKGHLQHRLDQLIGEHDVPGAAFGVVLGDEQIEIASGVLNVNTGAAVTPDSVFQIGSIGKIYTATVIMQMVDEGTVDLDEPVVTYVPELTLADPEATKTITVRQLLNHTSGIDGDHFEDFGRGDDCLERYVASMAELTQVTPPGRVFSYCNAGWVLAGRLVECVDGVGFDQAFTRRLFERLGMARSTMLPEEAILHGVSVGHTVDPGTKQASVVGQWMLPRSLGPAGLVCQPVGELLAFARLHLDHGRSPGGAQILSERSVAAMQQPSVTLPDPYTLGPAWGLGWILFDWGREAVIGHDGATLGQGGFLRLVPERHLAVALLANSDTRAPVYKALFNDVFSDLAGMSIPELPEPAEDARGIDLVPYTGVYERAGTRMDFSIVGDHLELSVRNTGPLAAHLPVPPPMRLRPVDKTTFVASSPEAVQPIPVVFFDFDGAGRPAFVHLGARATPRVTSH